MNAHEHPWPGGEPSQAVRAFGAFHRAMHAHRQLMARRFAGTGMHPAQGICLREVAHHEGITQRDLAERLHMARPTVTVMVQKMEKSGLIERRADTADQRYTRIYLSEAGHKAHEAMHRELERVVAETVEPLSERDQEELERLLNLLAVNIQKVSDGDMT